MWLEGSRLLPSQRQRHPCGKGPTEGVPTAAVIVVGAQGGLPDGDSRGGERPVPMAVVWEADVGTRSGGLSSG